MSYHGIFKPEHPEKYIGNVNNICYRSSLEFKFFRYCDGNNNILEWASEEIVVPYISPIDNRWHRYFPDICLKQIKNGNIEVIMIEIKPESQCHAPVQKGKKPSKRYIREVYEWGRNSAKWSAAEEYCKKKEWKFIVITENNIKKLPAIL